MASNITSAGSFTVANMKPAADEQIDALWGQNMGDIAAYLRKQPVPQYVPGEYTATVNKTSTSAALSAGTPFSGNFFLPAGHNTVVLQTRARLDSNYGSSGDNVGTVIWGIYGGLGTYLNTVTFTQANTSSYSFVSAVATTIPIGSYMAENTGAEFRCTMSGTTNDFSAPGATAGSHIFGFGSILAYTTWV